MAGGRRRPSREDVGWLASRRLLVSRRKLFAVSFSCTFRGRKPRAPRTRGRQLTFIRRVLFQLSLFPADVYTDKKHTHTRTRNLNPDNPFNPFHPCRLARQLPKPFPVTAHTRGSRPSGAGLRVELEPWTTSPRHNLRRAPGLVSSIY